MDRGQLRLVRNEEDVPAYGRKSIGGITSRKTLLFDPQTKTLIWEGRFINGSRMFEYEGRLWNVAECNLTNIYALRQAGFEIPLTTGYDWPIRPGWRPRDHQRVMVDFLLSYPRAFNLSDMGTQKTLAALWASDRIMQEVPGSRALILCPLSTMETIWADSIRYDFLGRRTFSILHGSAAQRMKALEKESDFYILNHDGLAVGTKTGGRKGLVATGFSLAIKNREDIKIVIYDEASALKKHTTRRARLAYAILGPRPYVWALTATPAPQSPDQAYGLALLVNKAQGQSYYHFKDKVMFKTPYRQFSWTARTDAPEQVAKLLHPAIRFSAEECNDIPPMTVQQRRVELSSEQKTALEELKRDLQATLKSGVQINAINEAAYRTKLIQIACGCVYDDQHVGQQLDCKPRLTALEEVVEECRQKIIVFAPFTSVVRMLYEGLRKKYTVAMITGATSAGERSKTFRSFQSSSHPRIIVADPGTMSHGLDLTAATVIVWYAPVDKAETYQQANARIHRPGQSYATTIVQIVSTSLEQEIFKRRAENISMQGTVLKLLEG